MNRWLRWWLRVWFRFRADNATVLRAPGPVLLIPNHVSWLDWLFLSVCLEGDWKFVVSRVIAEASWLRRRIMLNRRTFPIDTGSPYAVKHLAEYLRSGGRLVLFAEGRLSLTGELMKLFDGTGFLLNKTEAKVITGYLRGASRLPFSPNPGPKRWFPTVTAHFSEVLTPPKLTHCKSLQARTQLTDWVREQMLAQRLAVETAFGPRNILAAVVEAARRQPAKIILEDATRQPLTYRRMLVGAELLAQQLRVDEERVGVLLPNVNATPVVLLSLWAQNKVPALLNFSTGPVTMRACAQLAGLRHVITSRAFLERVKLDVQPLIEAGLQFIYLEDVRRDIRRGQKLRALVWPWNITRRLGDRDATAVILFTSGSEAEPKGVELTHANLLANIRQVLTVTDLQDSDRMLNCLPMFHSFGLTIGTLAPLVRGLYTFLYLSPLHYRIVPALVYDADCTVLLGTNTFLRGYARKAHPYDFRRLRHLFAAAEKLQEATATVWAQRYGQRVLEGYGATECAPCISVNTPLAAKFGSVGRLLPGMEYRLEPVEGLAEGGRLFVRGPNVMRGYLNPADNAKFQALDGWYDTGDVARVDADGYLYILDRLKRFAKVSGEMVSLTAVEDALAGAFPQFGLHCQVAILNRPDEAKGEVLIAVTNESKLQLDEIRAAIRARGLGNLSQPRELIHVQQIPKLGTGKINYRELAGMLLRAS